MQAFKFENKMSTYESIPFYMQTRQMSCTHRVNKVAQQQIVGGFPISKHSTYMKRREAC